MTRPITEIEVSTHREHLPDYSWVPVDLNRTVGGEYIYINYKRSDGAPITGISAVLGKNAAPPPGYVKSDLDLNKGAGGEYIYLCWKYDSDTPILDLIVQSTGSADQLIPNIRGKDYSKIPIDLNKGSGGDFIYLYYLQDTHEPPPDPPYGHFLEEWVNEEKPRIFEVARAQVAADKMLVHTLELEIEEDHLPPGWDGAWGFVQKLGVTETDKESVSTELKLGANLSFAKWGLTLGATLGLTQTTTWTHELSTSQYVETSESYHFVAGPNGTYVRTARVLDRIKVYSIPQGDGLEEALNYTKSMGIFTSEGGKPYHSFMVR
jgi:hypothetical protein